MTSFDSSHFPCEVKTVVFLLPLKSLRPREVHEQAKVVWVVIHMAPDHWDQHLGLCNFKVHACTGSIYAFRSSKRSTGGNPQRYWGIFVSFFTLPAEILQHSYFICHSPLFSDTVAITYNLLFKNQIQCWLDDRCSINPP